MTTCPVLPAQERYAVRDVPVAGGLLRVGEWEAVVAQGNPGTTVLAVHGVTASHRCWHRVVDGLLGRRFLAPDLRGRGYSNALPGPWGMAAHADDLVAVLDAAGVERAVVVGHSMGGFVSVVLAHRHPDRVASLVLVDGGLPLPVPEGLTPEQVTEAIIGPAARRLAMTFSDDTAYCAFWKAHPAFAEWDEVLEDYARYDLQGAPPALRPRTSTEAIEEDSRDLVGSDTLLRAVEALHPPATFLRAARGLLDEVPPLYPDTALDAWRERLPEVAFVTLPDVNHYTVVMGERGAAAVAHAVEVAPG